MLLLSQVSLFLHNLQGYISHTGNKFITFNKLGFTIWLTESEDNWDIVVAQGKKE